jgi:hypothetical protein
MKLIDKLSSLIRAVARGPAVPRAPQPPEASPAPAQEQSEDRAARLDQARPTRATGANARATSDRARREGPALERDRVADLLQRKEASLDADRRERDKGEQP